MSSVVQNAANFRPVKVTLDTVAEANGFFAIVDTFLANSAARAASPAGETLALALKAAQPNLVLA